jgi:hypothetical protein
MTLFPYTTLFRSVFKTISTVTIRIDASDTSVVAIFDYKTLRNCEVALGVIGGVMMLASFADLRTLTDGPLRLTLDPSDDDKPIFKLAKLFMFAIGPYFILQLLTRNDFRVLFERPSNYEADALPFPMAFRALGIFHVGALVGSAPFILQVFQGKGGFLLSQIVAAIFIALMVLTESIGSFTAMYAFGGLGLGALSSAMFTFLARTVTPGTTAEGVGIFVSLGLIGQGIVSGLLPVVAQAYIWFGLGAVWYAIVIAVTAIFSLGLPSSATDDPR